jgi:hypothetical protein
MGRHPVFLWRILVSLMAFHGASAKQRKIRPVGPKSCFHNFPEP